MIPEPYRPPRQSGPGQFFDSVFLVALVFLSLLAPVLLTSKEPAPARAAAQAGQWEKLGLTPADAKAMIEHRFDYTVDPLWLSVTAVVIVGYFVFVLTVSQRQYRDVIRERFGERS